MFDAYTVKKLLPRLIAVAILIQLSWPLAKFAVDIFNDIGVGVKELMFAPFDAAGKDVGDIKNALGSLSAGAEVTLLLGSIFLGAAVLFSGLTVVGVLMLALPVLLAVLVGYLVLVFRQILILLCVVFLPIALVMWIVPGTDRYWKLWRETFIKLLMMFPLIMALIAAGQIFGYIGGQSGGIPGLILVLVGFFGPLLILPKTFNWGGQALGVMGGAVVNGTKGIRGKPKDWATGTAAENRKYRGLARSQRLADNPENRRWRDRVLAGEFNVLRQRGRGGNLGAREMAFAQTLAEGEKVSRENVPAQLLRSGFHSWHHGPATDAQGNRIREGQAGYQINKLDALQAWLENREYAGIAPSAALGEYAFERLATLGDPDRLREARQSGHVDPQVWSKGLANNFGKINEIARYLTLAPDASTLTAGQLLTQDDDTARELERQLLGAYIHNRETGGNIDLTPEQHTQQLQRAGQLATDAFANRQMWDNLSGEKKRVLQAAHAMATAAGLDVGHMERPEDRRGRPADEPPPPAPEPPAGPGHEDVEVEVRIDR